jgi:hypothetical protein
VNTVISCSSQNKCHSIVTSAPVSYSEGLEFESQLLTDVSYGFSKSLYVNVVIELQNSV